jgi:hypothetical protein
MRRQKTFEARKGTRVKKCESLSTPSRRCPEWKNLTTSPYTWRVSPLLTIQLNRLYCGRRRDEHSQIECSGYVQSLVRPKSEPQPPRGKSSDRLICSLEGKKGLCARLAGHHQLKPLTNQSPLFSVIALMPFAVPFKPGEPFSLPPASRVTKL